MRIAFLGTGAMGLPMARNLVAAGHEVTAWNRTRARAEAVEGATVADTPAEAARGVEAVITMLADDAAVEQAVFGDEGLLDALPAGAVHVCAATISVALSRRLAEAHAARGQGYVAAPVFGRPDAAEGRRLKIVAAGAPDVAERVRPLLDALGERTFWMGDDAPAAHVVKLCGNFLLASMVEVLGEAFALARKSGVEASALEEVLSGTLLGSPILPGYARLVASERWTPPGFPMKLGLKDVRLVLAAADAAAVPMPVAGVVHDRMLSGVARGRGELDWAAAAALVAEAAGLESPAKGG
ncbi:NAD(P)-dependent oxidoreductase [Longimicrobium sp.]|uniref:NAD(P)-dependent oxidoreductase n=1 Tax=Longimicrobium sp. TaxID=2029185 RepID=UPI002E3612FC|nr:NAD(P)-dependent oxidoreductase [Longimicrobium sp.]HEX6041158.1 NAD(P)-dependent oxidoreductase [Longimicrobium sp.]